MMNGKLTFLKSIVICFIGFYCFHQNLCSQTFTLTRFPAPLQLYPRDKFDSAIVPIKGNISTPGFDSALVQVFKNGNLYQRLSAPLLYISGTAQFSFYPTIHAELSEYRFQLFVKNIVQTVQLVSRDSIVCGDVFLINGQSNSWPANGGATYVNEFCRGFGRSTGYNPYNAADTLWGLARATGYSNYLAHTGVWGLKLQQLIKENFNIPICIINGGSGGSSIEYNLPNDANLTDLNTTYGRLLYRVTKAGLVENVKAILWHQGESNTNATWINYQSNFQTLYNAWHRDYQGLQKVYVFQIHQGCGGINQNEIRELQRNFPKFYPDLEIMSTVGISGHDGCHYNLQGYQQMAGQIFKQVARDFYGSMDVVDIDPPNIIKAFYTSPAHDKIALVFGRTNSLVWQSDTLGQSLKNYFYLDGNYGAVTSGSMHDDTLFLSLTGKSSATKITYLPNIYYNNTTTIYEGPWVKNSRGVGALSFYEFPIAFPPDGAPILLTPINNVINQPPAVSFRWKKVLFADSYQLQVSTDSLFVSTVIDISSIVDTSFKVNQLNNDLRYFWRVRAKNALINSVWSTIWNFTTIVSLPSTPLLSSPKNGEAHLSTAVVMQWNTSDHASSYHLQISTDSSFGIINYDLPTLTNTYFSFASLNHNTKYFWRVQAKNVAGASAWSEIWNFTTVDTIPSPCTLASPLHQSVNQSTTIIFQWNKNNRAERYWLQTASDSLFSTIIFDDTTLVDTFYVLASLLHNQKYFWRVKAINVGGQSDWSIVWYFTTIIESPASTILSLPKNGAANQSSSISLNWHSSDRAAAYHLQVALDSQFKMIVLQDSTITDTIRAVMLLQYDTKYFWRVRALNVGGAGEWSDVWSFTTIIEKPERVILSSPTDGSADQTIPLSLQWNYSARAVSYRLQISSDTNFQNNVIDESNIVTNYFATNSLQYDTKYFWRVCAINIGGASYWSEIWSFATIIAQPSIPTLVSPLNDATSQPITLTLQWNPANSAKRYHVQVSTDSLFNNLIINDSTVQLYALNISSLSYDQRYFWRVRSMNSIGKSNWSDIWNFKTSVELPPKPILVSPPDKSINQLVNFTLYWNSSQRAVSYDVHVSRDASFSNIDLSLSKIISTSTDISGLLFNKTYYWRVRAENDGGKTQWSDVWAFTTIIETSTVPILISPQNGTVVTSLPITLSWNSVLAAGSYEMQLAIDTTFANIFILDSLLYANACTIGLLNPNTKYFWRVRAKNAGGISSWSAVWTFTTGVLSDVDYISSASPQGFFLSQNYPNPIDGRYSENSFTRIQFSIPENNNVILKVLNVLGEEVMTVVDGALIRGTYEVKLNISNFKGGIYVYRLQVGRFSQIKKLILIK